jgi:hypothetical protein
MYNRADVEAAHAGRDRDGGHGWDRRTRDRRW